MTDGKYNNLNIVSKVESYLESFLEPRKEYEFNIAITKDVISIKIWNTKDDT